MGGGGGGVLGHVAEASHASPFPQEKEGEEGQEEEPKDEAAQEGDGEVWAERERLKSESLQGCAHCLEAEADEGDAAKEEGDGDGQEEGEGDGEGEDAKEEGEGEAETEAKAEEKAEDGEDPKAMTCRSSHLKSGSSHPAMNTSPGYRCL